MSDSDTTAEPGPDSEQTMRVDYAYSEAESPHIIRSHSIGAANVRVTLCGTRIVHDEMDEKVHTAAFDELPEDTCRLCLQSLTA